MFVIYILYIAILNYFVSYRNGNSFTSKARLLHIYNMQSQFIINARYACY